MWFQTTSKKQLGDLLERGSSSPNLFGGSEHPPDGPPRNGELVLVWPDRPTANETPTAIVVENTQRRDLLAWAASFANSYRPFTAHVHVINFNTCTALLEPQRPRPKERGIAAAVGAILGDALAAAGQSSDLSVNDCARTYAYAMGRGYSLGLSGLFSELTSAWQVFASLTHHAPDKRLDLERKSWPWMALAAAPDDGPHSRVENTNRLIGSYDRTFRESARVLRELYEHGEVSQSTLFSLQAEWPSLEPMLPMLRDTREVRVTAFQKFVSDLANMPRQSGDADELTFVVGYIASRLAPGSLEYFRILRPMEQHLPGVLVWYGICAALQGDDFIASSGGLGRRLHRDLSAGPTFPQRPRADISVWDLEVFARSESTPLSLLGSGSFDVELMPDIICIAPSRASRPSQPSVFADRDAVREAPASRSEESPTPNELKSLLAELKQALGRVANVQYKLERLTGGLDSTRASAKGRQRR